MSDDVIHDWRETVLVSNVDITDTMLTSDAEYLTLTLYKKALKNLQYTRSVSQLGTEEWTEPVSCMSGS